jgi:formate dehydrogenase subunit gamma
MSTTQHSERADLVCAMAAAHADERGPLLLILHEVMDEFGYIDATDIPIIADVLNLSTAEVHGVVSFYHDFRTTPPSGRVLALCRGEACQAVGAEDLFTTARRLSGSRADVEVRQIFCLGNCALGPSGMIDGVLQGRLTADVVTAAVEGKPS